VRNGAEDNPVISLRLCTIRYEASMSNTILLFLINLPLTILGITTSEIKTWWRIWLRQFAASRKGAGSIPDGVIWIFHWHNPSGRTVALGSTQSLTGMNSSNFLGRWPVFKADNLTTFMCRLSWNLGASNSWQTQCLSRPVMGLLYLYTLSNSFFPIYLYRHTIIIVINQLDAQNLVL